MASALIPIISALAPVLLQHYFSSQSKGGNDWSGRPGGQVGFSQNFDPQKMQVFQQLLSQIGADGNSFSGSAIDTLRQQMQPFDQSQYEQMFQQGVVDPSIKNFQQQIIPGIVSQYSGGGHTTALNNAIQQGSESLGKDLASTKANYLLQQQGSHQNRQLQAAMQSLGLVQNTFNTQNQSPIIQQPQQGQMWDFIKGLIGAGGQYAASQYQPGGGQPSQGGSNTSTPWNDPSIYGAGGVNGGYKPPQMPSYGSNLPQANFSQFVPQSR